MHARLTRRLRVHCYDVLAPERPERFGTVIASRVVRDCESLQTRLAAITRSTDVEASHAARIAAKRLRYIIEPVSDVVSGGDAIIVTLKTLQDALGELRDVHVVSNALATLDAGAAARPALLRLAHRVHHRGALAYETIERDWRNGAASAFFDAVRTLAAVIERQASARGG